MLIAHNEEKPENEATNGINALHYVLSFHPFQATPASRRWDRGRKWVSVLSFVMGEDVGLR